MKFEQEMSINDIQRYTVGFDAAAPEGIASVSIVGGELLDLAGGVYTVDIDGSKIRFYLKKKPTAQRPTDLHWDEITITATTSSIPPRVLERKVYVRVI